MHVWIVGNEEKKPDRKEETKKRREESTCMRIYEIASPEVAAAVAAATATIPGTPSRCHRYSFVRWTHSGGDICT